jgi:hypothetical protein
MLLTTSSDVGTCMFKFGLLDARDGKYTLRWSVTYFKGTSTNVSISVSSTDDVRYEIFLV